MSIRRCSLHSNADAKQEHSPASIVTGLADGHATQVGADTQHDQPLGALGAVLITLGVTEGFPLDLAGLVDLTLGTVTDENGLTTPLDDDLLRDRVLVEDWVGGGISWSDKV